MPFIDLDKVSEARELFREHMRQISLIEDIEASGKRQKVFLLSLDEKPDLKENKKKPRISDLALEQYDDHTELPKNLSMSPKRSSLKVLPTALAQEGLAKEIQNSQSV